MKNNLKNVAKFYISEPYKNLKGEEIISLGLDLDVLQVQFVDTEVTNEMISKYKKLLINSAFECICEAAKYMPLKEAEYSKLQSKKKRATNQGLDS